MTIIKRFKAFFIASAIMLTLSGVWSTTVYAVVYPPQTKKAPVTSNTTVGDVWTYNYTQGMDIYAKFTNNGTVNVSGGSFNIIGTYTVENNKTFTFTGTNNTFSLGSSGTFVNNGTATITNVYNFGSPSGSSFINNGTLYLENISNINLQGFTNYGVIIFPDEAKNGYVYLQFELKCQYGGQVYTKTEWENRKLNYQINYEGLSADGYYDYENPNPTYYEWSAADAQDVTLAEPTLPGYEFLGWTGLDVTKPVKNFTFSSSERKEVTVTAHWKPAVYSISYELDGGSFSVGNTPNTEYSRGGQPGLIVPHKVGYTFAGWIDTDTNEQVSAGDAIYYLPPQTLGNKTYKASFIANTDTQYKVICYYQNIDGTYSEEKYLMTGETGAQVRISSENYTKEGFTFDSDNSGSLLYGTIKADNSLELKLYFKCNKYTVTFKSQDGSETLWTTEKYFNEKVGEYGGEIPSKTSDDDLYTYVFDNWARGEADREFGYDVSRVVVSEDITFYAAFKKVRDESTVVIKWEEHDGFNAPVQTEIRLDKGADYTVELRLINENYYVGTKEWSLGFQEAHIYWYDPQSGEHGTEYTVSKENFEAPVILTIPDIQHDTFIKIKANYHEEHDYSSEYDEIIQNGSCTSDSVIRHFCYKCGKTYDETVKAGGHVLDSAFETDEVSHWKTCTICNKAIGLEAHISDEGVVTQEPTHNSSGTKTYTCTVCGYVIKTEVIPALSEGGIPFIKNESEKNGWEAIKAEAENAAEGRTVAVDMNGTTVVPGYVIDVIAGKDVTLVFYMEDDIAWSVNGKSVTVENAGDIDFSVRKNIGSIPVDVVNKLTGERYSIQISLAHNGEFGFTAVLSINLGSGNSGLCASLYFYGNGGLELIDESEIEQDGTARFTFTHASDYLIVVGEKSNNSPETGEAGAPWKIILIGSIAAIAGAFSIKIKKYKAE